jgi:NAD(P)H-hydrate repair Nnr-like enzyme with NAD(P)H-hydrate dehydratase domain
MRAVRAGSQAITLQGMTKALSLLNRSPDVHKGSHGSVGIVGGAAGTVGAGFLSARSALCWPAASVRSSGKASQPSKPQL